MKGRPKPMTPRQAEVIDLVAEGLGDKEIARRLGISTNTVRTHLQRVFQEQRVPNRAAAASVRTEERAPASPAPARLRSLLMIGTLLAVASLALGGPRVLGLASGLMGPARSTPPPPVPSAAATRPADARASAPATSETASSSRPATAAGVSSGRVSAAVPLPEPGPLATVADAAHLELAEVNRVRAAGGSPPLAWNPCLAGVAATAAGRIAAGAAPVAAGALPPHAPCTASPQLQMVTDWPSTDDAAATRVLLANPTSEAALLGPHTAFGAAWAADRQSAYLVIEIA